MESAEALRGGLYERIRNHRQHTYNDLKIILPELYRDPADPTRLILFYSQWSWPSSAFDPGSGSIDYWNREHMWPVSYGIGSANSNPQYTDLFHVVPANKLVNNQRGNKYFDDIDPADADLRSNATGDVCRTTSRAWEPADGQKGWVSRSMFYMVVRYPNLNLQLVDTPPAAAPAFGSPRMAQLNVLLRWNRYFAPEARERVFNDRVFLEYQQNRNPFIDFPEFADWIWVDGPSWGRWRLSHFSLAELSDGDLAGDAADPDADGIPNLIELAQYANPRMPAPGPALQARLAGDSIELQFDRARDSSQLGVRLAVQVSTDLLHWQELSPESEAVQPISAEQERVTLLVPLASAHAQFFRLVAERARF